MTSRSSDGVYRATGGAGNGLYRILIGRVEDQICLLEILCTVYIEYSITSAEEERYVFGSVSLFVCLSVC